MLKSNYKIQNENVGSSEVPSWLSKEPKERLKIYKIDKTNIDKDKYDFEFSPFTRNEKKENTSSQREKTFKLFEMIRNSEIGGDKFYLGPYGYKRSKPLFFIIRDVLTFFGPFIRWRK